MLLRETVGTIGHGRVVMKDLVRVLVAAGLAVAMLGATVVEASASPRFRGVTFTNDLITLVAPFTEVGVKASTDVTVHLSASSWARYSCLLPSGKPSGVKKTVDAGLRSSKVSGTSSSKGMYSDTAYLDPGLVYPGCPGKQTAHLERVCFTHPRLADKQSGAAYSDPNVAHICIRTA
jgi:hypothetical protein